MSSALVGAPYSEQVKNMTSRVLLFSSSERVFPYEIDKEIDTTLTSDSGQFDPKTIIRTVGFTQEPSVLFTGETFFDDNIRYDEENRKEKINNAVSRLVNEFQFYDYSQDSENSFWKIVDEIAASSFSILGAALQDIVIKFYNSPNILCSVAICLCNFDLIQTEEWGPMILISLLNHKNDTVKEYATMLLDNWNDSTLLPILKNIDCHAAWLRAYMDSVIAKLEG